MIDSLLSSGLQGIQSSVNSARQAAQDITAATVRPETFDPQESERPVDGITTTQAPQRQPDDDSAADIVDAVVVLKASEQQAAASAAVVKTADDIIGTILDTKA